MIWHESTLDDGLRLIYRSDPAGHIESPAFQNTLISIHVGSSVHIDCRRGGFSHRGLAVHGDIDIIPAGTPSIWEIGRQDAAFFLSIPNKILNSAAEYFDCDPSRIEIRNRFQIRDLQLENIGWALKAEMECGYPSGRLYLDGLTLAAATRLVNRHSSLSTNQEEKRGRLSGLKLKLVLSYIEDNLSQNISLYDLAAVAGLSVSHFKTLFHQSVGMPAHQYLVHRRVDRARSLLTAGKLPISQIAMNTGFANQSHLAYHMRRLTGISPKAIRKMFS